MPVNNTTLVILVLLLTRQLPSCVKGSVQATFYTVGAGVAVCPIHLRLLLQSLLLVQEWLFSFSTKAVSLLRPLLC